MAESVSSARLVPCVSTLPDGWAVESFSADDRAGTFSLAHEDGATLRVVLRATCVPADDPFVGAAQPEGLEQRMTRGDDGEVRWTTTFTGGCVVETLSAPRPQAADEDAEIHDAIDFLPRDELAREFA
jgi:hypothetical protein